MSEHERRMQEKIARLPTGILNIDWSTVRLVPVAVRQDPDCPCECCQDVVIGCVCASDGERCNCAYCLRING